MEEILKLLNTSNKDSLIDAINEVHSDIDTHAAKNASTSVSGHVKLNNAVTSTSTTEAATANAVKMAYDLANSKSGASVATTSANGLMSSGDKTKLDGIAASANNYSLPAATASVRGGVITGTNITNSSGTISVANATTSVKGVVQLSEATNSTSAALAATASAVKKAYDRAEQAFQSASDGKTAIINAVTGANKNATIPTNPTFDQLASAITEIGSIQGGELVAGKDGMGLFKHDLTVEMFPCKSYETTGTNYLYFGPFAIRNSSDFVACYGQSIRRHKSFIKNTDEFVWSHTVTQQVRFFCVIESANEIAYSYDSLTIYYIDINTGVLKRTVKIGDRPTDKSVTSTIAIDISGDIYRITSLSSDSISYGAEYFYFEKFKKSDGVKVYSVRHTLLGDNRYYVGSNIQFNSENICIIQLDTGSEMMNPTICAAVMNPSTGEFLSRYYVGYKANGAQHVYASRNHKTFYGGTPFVRYAYDSTSKALTLLARVSDKSMIAESYKNDEIIISNTSWVSYGTTTSYVFYLLDTNSMTFKLMESNTDTFEVVGNYTLRDKSSIYTGDGTFVMKKDSYDNYGVIMMHLYGKFKKK